MSHRGRKAFGRQTLCLLFVLVGCTGPRTQVNRALNAQDLSGALTAYDRFRESSGADPVLLADVAALLLAQEGAHGSPEVARAAIRALRRAGPKGHPALQRIAQNRTVSNQTAPNQTAPNQAARADSNTSSEGAIGLRQVWALDALATSGDDDAAALLWGLADHPNEGFLPFTLRGADPVDDRSRLLALARHAQAEVRRAAVLQLTRRQSFRGAALSQALGLERALVQIARGDEDAGVRAAALRGLAAFGARGAEVFRERLSDTDVRVRLAAAYGLITYGAEASHEQLRTWFEGPAGRASIEAARVFLSMRLSQLQEASDAPEDAEAAQLLALGTNHLAAALNHPDPLLRSQAAVAWLSVPYEDPAPLRLALEREGAPAVRLQLARALAVSDTEGAAQGFRGLLSTPGMIGLQAAGELSRSGEAAALDLLEATLAGDGPTLLRQVAARALARRAGRPEELRPVLEDRDPLVRIEAAGAILSMAPRD